MKTIVNFLKNYFTNFSIVVRWVVIESLKKGFYALAVKGMLLAPKLAYLGSIAKTSNATLLPESPFVYTMQ